MDETQPRLLAECPQAIPVVAAWLLNEFGHLEPENTHDILARRLEERLNVAGCPVTFVTFEGENPVGTVSLIESDLDACPQLSPWLADMYVQPAHRGRGHGERLARRVAEYASVNGYPKLYLYTPNRQAFFGRLGWVEMDTQSLHGVPISVMERELGSNPLPSNF